MSNKNSSRRARRMERHHARRKSSGINLVSLMDIFTILVFFLLASSSNVQQLPSTKDMKLPTSVTQNAPDETLTIMITDRDILVDGQRVSDINSALGEEGNTISGLENELKFQASKVSLTLGEQKYKAVTILGDEDTPYELLSKILATCRVANYTRVSFAAEQQSKAKG